MRNIPSRLRSIQAGDMVNCRLFNRPMGKFYGPTFLAEVVAFRIGEDKPVLVKRQTGGEIWLHRKEILNIAG